MPRIVVLDSLSEDGLNLMKAAHIEYEERIGLKGEELRSTLMDFDGAICRSGVKITAESLEGNKRLKAIARAGVGVDNIDLKAATRHGIIVMNTPGGNTVSTAEQTFALLLSLSRNIHPAYQSLIEGRWDRKKFTGHQLGGKILGIIGMGRIGQTVAKFAKAFDMKVLAFDPYLSAQRAKELGVTVFDTIAELLPQVDYLTVHTPLNDATRNLIDTKEIQLLKKGACLINCARGGIYNMDALVEGLKSGQLGGVAIDVYPEEPCTSHPLFGMPNVVCTPHLGASTEEAQTNVALEAVQLLIDYLNKGVIRQAVNFSPLDPETLRDLRGYLDVAYRLGLLSSQIALGAINCCTLKFKGEISSKNTTLLTSAFTAGLLTSILDEQISIVSAAPMAQERGLKIVEEKSNETGDFRSTLGADIQTDKGTTSILGTVFGNSMPRLIQMDDQRLESYLDGNLLFFLHKDVPGVIGTVGGVTAKYNVNIAHMSVGRNSHQQPGQTALGILSLDSPLSPQALEEIKSKEKEIEKVVAVTLPALGQYPSWMS
ncbi:MAG: phosphoglycerate dehydrogenase [Planctomycetia bacterium]|nr:phosphoglycerate dehydrogenase [Planctomycetia bacterium]